MKPDEILEKTLKGELHGDALTEEVGKLSVEEQAELTKLSKESAAKSLTEASGLRKERDRINELKTQAEKDAEAAANKAAEVAAAVNTNSQAAPAKDETMSQFRKEQKDKAVARFNDKFKDLPVEQRTAVLQQFEKFDSGLIDSDNIYNEIIGAYAFVNRDTLLIAEQEKQAREAEAAAQATADAGGSKGEPNNGNQPPKFTPAVQDLAKKAGISPEAAQAVATQGMTRVRQ